MNDGTNNPPETAALDRAAETLARIKEWLEDHPAIQSAAEAGEVSGFVASLRSLKTDLGKAQDVEIAPHEEAMDRVKARFSPTMIDVVARGKLLLTMAGDWLARERQREAAEKAARDAEARRLREEADRLERERMEQRRRENEEAARAKEEAERDPVREAQLEAERAERERLASDALKVAREAERAATKKAAPVTIKSDSGARAIRTVTYWSAVVTDEAAAIETYRDHEEVRAATLAAALKVATAIAKATKSESGAPAGFRFVKDERAV